MGGEEEEELDDGFQPKLSWQYGTWIGSNQIFCFAFGADDGPCEYEKKKKYP